MPQAVVSNHNARMLCLGKFVFTKWKLMRPAPLHTPSPTPVTPHCDLNNLSRAVIIYHLPVNKAF